MPPAEAVAAAVQDVAAGAVALRQEERLQAEDRAFGGEAVAFAVFPDHPLRCDFAELAEDRFGGGLRDVLPPCDPQERLAEPGRGVLADVDPAHPVVEEAGEVHAIAGGEGVVPRNVRRDACGSQHADGEAVVVEVALRAQRGGGPPGEFPGGAGGIRVDAEVEGGLGELDEFRGLHEDFGEFVEGAQALRVASAKGEVLLA